MMKTQYLPIWGIEQVWTEWTRNSDRFVHRRSNNLPAPAGRSWTWYYILYCCYRKLGTILHRGSRAVIGSAVARTIDIRAQMTWFGTLFVPRIPLALQWHFHISRTWWEYLKMCECSNCTSYFLHNACKIKRIARRIARVKGIITKEIIITEKDFIINIFTI